MLLTIMKSLEQKIITSWDSFIIYDINNEKSCGDISLLNHLIQDEGSLLEERFNIEDYFEDSFSFPTKQRGRENCLQQKEELLHFLKEFKIQKEIFGRILFKQELQRIDAEMLD